MPQVDSNYDLNLIPTKQINNDCLPISGGICHKVNADQFAIVTAIVNANSGDTIRILPGTAIFTSTINVTKPLYIIGSGIDSTIIQDNSFQGTFHLSSPGMVRLSGFTLTGVRSGSNGSISIFNDNKRLDHIRFNQIGGTHPIRSFGNLSNVVIDHSTFEASNRGANMIGSKSYWTDQSQYIPGKGWSM